MGSASNSNSREIAASYKDSSLSLLPCGGSGPPRTRLEALRNITFSLGWAPLLSREIAASYKDSSLSLLPCGGSGPLQTRLEAPRNITFSLRWAALLSKEIAASYKDSSLSLLPCRGWSSPEQTGSPKEHHRFLRVGPTLISGDSYLLQG